VLNRSFLPLIVALSVAATAIAPSVSRAELVTDAGAGLGMPLAVPSGTVITVKIFHDTMLTPPPFGAAAGFDGVGLDLLWSTTGGGAALPTTPTLLAGPLAGAGSGGAGSMDLFSGAIVGPGAPLSLPPVPAAPPAGFFGMGGAGYFDPAFPAAAGGANFSGLTAPVGMPLDLMGASFTVTGSPGDTITFEGVGILMPVPIVGPPPPLLAPPGMPAATTPLISFTEDAYLESLLPAAFGSTTYATAFEVVSVPVTVTIVVPEPSAFLYGGLMSALAGGVYCLKRRLA